MIEDSAFEKKRITLEITENIFINDVDYILALLEKIIKQNIVISLDDFGTGYSSLSLLKKLPIHELKIDKSFVDDILYDKRALNMVESIITIAKNLDMTILAEGIEKIEQKEILEKYGCGLFQGYYYAKPLKIEDLKSYIISKN
jgi:EAL domain-containing protein (putative c-di-GMP-specific phosphodiesterase class I)